MKNITIIAVLILLASCANVKRSSTQNISHKDTTAVAKSQSGTISHKEDATVKKQESEVGSKVEIEFDPADFNMDTAKASTGTWMNVDTIREVTTAPHFNPEDYFVKTGHVRKITFTNYTKTALTDSSGKKHKDSTFNNRSDSTHAVIATINRTDTVRKNRTISMILWGLAGLAVIYVLWQLIPLLIRLKI